MNFILKSGILFLVISSIIFSCKKEKDTTVTTTQTITGPPSSFEAKAVIEVFSGEFDTDCPAGASTLKSILDANANKVYGAVVHYGDAFEPIFYSALAGYLGGVGEYPTAAINRVPATNAGAENDYVVYSPTNWNTNITRFINKKVGLGLALETTITSDNKVAIKVKVHNNGTVDLSKNKLTVYVLENNVTANNQIGATAGYKHQNLLRAALTSTTGDDIALVANETFTKDFQFVLPSNMNKDEVQILAFVNRTGANTSLHGIVNAQQVKLGQNKNWD